MNDLTTEGQGALPAMSPAELIKSAVAGGADLDKLEKLLVLQERWEANEAKKAYNADMAQVHAQMPHVIKSAFNPQTKSKYALLESVISSAKEVYAAHGFAVAFYEGDCPREGQVRVMADVTHRLGHSVTYHYDVPLDGVGLRGNANMTAIHGKASSVSYGRRYILCMIFNIPTGDDDDGNAAAVVEFISEKQIGILRDMLIDLGAEEEKFLSWLKVDSLENIPASAYNKALGALQESKKRKAASQ